VHRFNRPERSNFHNRRSPTCGITGDILLPERQD
jgi:hypothetical protein